MGQLVFQATLGGQVNLVGPNTASTFNLDVPAVNSTLSTTSGTETLTNKTLTTPVINGFTGSTAVVNIGSGQFYKDTSGNVGIGTASPSYKLNISGTGYIFGLTGGGTSRIAQTFNNTGGGLDIGIESSAGGAFFTGGSAYASCIGSNNATPLQLGTNGTIRATLDSSGRLLVGTTSSIGTAVVGRLQVLGGETFITTNSEVGGFVGVNSNIDNSVAIVADPDSLRSGSHIAFYVDGFSEKARINSSGDVGIGRTNPGSRLAVAANSSPYQISLSYDTSAAGFVIGSPSSDALAFYNWAGTERARIDSSGNLLVGGTAILANASYFGYSPGNTWGVFAHASGVASGTEFVKFYYNNGQIGSITQSGTTAVLYNVTSDQRLKENIVDSDSASTLIDALQVRQFDWKADGNHQRYGFIAQELVTVAPEAVHQPADSEAMMAVDYSKLVPMLVKEIQSLRQRVAQLESN